MRTKDARESTGVLELRIPRLWYRYLHSGSHLPHRRMGLIVCQSWNIRLKCVYAQRPQMIFGLF